MLSTKRPMGVPFRIFALRAVGVAIRVEEQRAVLVADEEAGSNRVRADARAREVRRQPLREVADGSLRARSTPESSSAGCSVHGRDVQDVAALAGDMSLANA